jgi:hypothetical protein
MFVDILNPDVAEKVGAGGGGGVLVRLVCVLGGGAQAKRATDAKAVIWGQLLLWSHPS